MLSQCLKQHHHRSTNQNSAAAVLTSNKQEMENWYIFFLGNVVTICMYPSYLCHFLSIILVTSFPSYYGDVIFEWLFKHYPNLRRNLNANLRSNLSVNMKWGKPNPCFSMTYSPRKKCNCTSIPQRFKKTKTFINVACIVFEFIIKEHRRYLQEHVSCSCFYYPSNRVETACFLFLNKLWYVKDLWKKYKYRAYQKSETRTLG